MIKLIILSVVLIGLHSCAKPGKAQSTKPSNELSMESDNYYTQYQVYTLNGCEYIKVGIGHDQWGSHKGDCTNPIHKCNCK